MKSFLCLLSLAIIINISCRASHFQINKKDYSEEYKRNFCHKLEKRIGHKVTYIDKYGDKKIMKVGFEFRATLNNDNYDDERYVMNCVIYTQGSKHNDYPFVLNSVNYANFDEIYNYIKKGR